MSDRDDDDRRESRRRRIAEASYDVGYGKPPAANRFRPRNQMAKRRRRHGISSSLADLIRAKGKQKMMLNVGGQQVSMSATRPSYTFFSRTLTRAAKKDIYLWFKLRSEADAQVTPSDIQAEFRRETEQDAEAFTKAVMDMAARAKQEKLNQ